MFHSLVEGLFLAVRTQTVSNACIESREAVLILPLPPTHFTDEQPAWRPYLHEWHILVIGNLSACA